MLVADFIGVVALFDWLADFEEAGDKCQECCGVLVFSQIRPVLGVKLHGADSDDRAQPFRHDGDHRSEMIAIRGGHPVDIVWVSVSKGAVNR